MWKIEMVEIIIERLPQLFMFDRYIEDLCLIPIYLNRISIHRLIKQNRYINKN